MKQIIYVYKHTGEHSWNDGKKFTHLFSGENF